MFNHSQTPNLNYIRDYDTGSIKYITSRKVQTGEELCIFYSAKLWFEVSLDSELRESEDEGDSFSKMMDLDFGVQVEGPGKVIPEEDLPFEALDINNLVQEEDLESVRVGQLNWRGFIAWSVADRQPVDAWVVDLPDPKHTATLLR